MHDLASYVEADPANRNRNGLEVGDVIDAGLGPAQEVVAIDDEGVEFSDGSTASHCTVCANMADLGLL